MQGGQKRAIGDLQTLSAAGSHLWASARHHARRCRWNSIWCSDAFAQGWHALSGKRIGLCISSQRWREICCSGCHNTARCGLCIFPLRCRSQLTDLAAIPNGAALPSTSKFLHPPSATVPSAVASSPAWRRVFKNNTELWLRVFPDDIHVNSFEPELTADESTARTAFLDRSRAGRTGRTGRLHRAGSPIRTAARCMDCQRKRAGRQLKRLRGRKLPSPIVLPERWLVMGYQGNAAGQLLAVGSPIADSLGRRSRS